MVTIRVSFALVFSSSLRDVAVEGFFWLDFGSEISQSLFKYGARANVCSVINLWKK